jgi:hypothetical protein
MGILEIILLLLYGMIFLLGISSVLLTLNYLHKYQLNSTQRNIQYLSFASLGLSFLWGVFYLPWNYLIIGTLAPALMIFLLKSFYPKFDLFMLKYKFIVDTILIFLSIDLWILS